MANMIICELCQKAVQLRRVGGCVRQVFTARRAYNANGANAGRPKTHGQPNLADKRRNRCFAIGAGHRHGKIRLLAKKPRCHPGKQLPRIGRFDHRASPLIGTRAGNNRAGSAPEGLVNIFGAIISRSRQCGKHKSGLDLTAVRREPGDGNGTCRRGNGGIRP